MKKQVYVCISDDHNDRSFILNRITDEWEKSRDNFSFDFRLYSETYSPHYVNDADIILVAHPKNKFEFSISELKDSCDVELTRAIEQKKEIFLLYYNRHRELGYYKVCKTFLDKGIVKGIAGDSKALQNYLGNLKEGEEEEHTYNVVNPTTSLIVNTNTKISYNPYSYLDDKGEIIKKSFDRRLLLSIR